MTWFDQVQDASENIQGLYGFDPVPDSWGGGTMNIITDGLLVALYSSLTEWVAAGKSPDQWLQDAMKSYPELARDIHDMYGGFMADYTPGMTRPQDVTGGAPAGYSPPASSSPLGSNEGAFLAAAIAVLGIAIYALRAK